MNKVKTRENSYLTYKRNNGKDEVWNAKGYDCVTNFCNLRIQQKCTNHKVSYQTRDTIMALRSNYRPISKISAAGYIQPNQPYIQIYQHQAVIKNRDCTVLYTPQIGGQI